MSCHNKILWLECECHTETLQIAYDFNKEDDLLFLSVYKLSKNKFSFGHRLKHIWKIIRTGDPYSDQMILKKDNIKKLISFLEFIVKK